MPKVSRIQIEGKRLNYFISNLWNTITLIENRKEVVEFLKELLTPTEIRMLAKRIQIAKMLLEGYKYEDIIPHVRVTPNTINSVNKQLQFGSRGYVKIIERLIKLEQQKQKQMENRLGGKRNPFDPGPGSGKGIAVWTANKLAQQALNYSKRKSVQKEIT